MEVGLKQKIIEAAKDMNDQEALEGDGWSILSPAYFTEKFKYPAEFINPMDRHWEPDGSPKGIIKTCDGVYYLDFLYAVAYAIEASTAEAETKMGRGFQAQCLVVSIQKRLAELGDGKDAERNVL